MIETERELYKEKQKKTDEEEAKATTDKSYMWVQSKHLSWLLWEYTLAKINEENNDASYDIIDHMVGVLKGIMSRILDTRLR